MQQSENPGTKLVKAQLSRLSLIRDVYRFLINGGRSYAAFTDRERALVVEFRDQKEIFDPMSGYGLLTQYCSQTGLSSYCVEYNLPQYLWQILCLPQYAERMKLCVDYILDHQKDWPQSYPLAAISNDWIPEESKPLIHSLLNITQSAVNTFFNSHIDSEAITLALILPFTGKFMCFITGDVSTRAKEGGLCIYRGWNDDFIGYLNALRERLSLIQANALSLDHEVLYNDARYTGLPQGRFSAMVTSPPYPNYRDYETMFAAENALLEWLHNEGYTKLKHLPSTIIGTTIVSSISSRKIRSSTALKFIDSVCVLKLDKRAKYDDSVYYLPYLINYFADLEDAYTNISAAFARHAVGYITVVNNTHRSLIIPVAETIIEIWKSLGFDAIIDSKFESFHVGTKNPRARGVRARHTEYVVKVWR